LNLLYKFYYQNKKNKEIEVDSKLLLIIKSVIISDSEH